jgi:hypothetical protein
MKKLFKILGWGIVSLTLLTLLIAAIDSITASAGRQYRHSKHRPSRDFILQAFKEIPQAKAGQIALAWDANINQADTELPLQKGYDLIAIDGYWTGFELMIPHYDRYRDKVKIFRLDDLYWDMLPKNVDLVMASFVLLFDTPDGFKEITHRLKPGGYFIGNFMDPDNTFFLGKDRDGKIFHTKEQVLSLLKGFKILKFKEVKYPDDASDHCYTGDHYYEVFAQKVG